LCAIFNSPGSPERLSFHWRSQEIAQRHSVLQKIDKQCHSERHCKLTQIIGSERQANTHTPFAHHMSYTTGDDVHETWTARCFDVPWHGSPNASLFAIT